MDVLIHVYPLLLLFRLFSYHRLPEQLFVRVILLHLICTNPVPGITYNWYDAPNAGTLLGTGTSITIPSVPSATDYYVEASNGSCINGRTVVTVSMTHFAYPRCYCRLNQSVGRNLQLATHQWRNRIPGFCERRSLWYTQFRTYRPFSCFNRVKLFADCFH